MTNARLGELVAELGDLMALDGADRRRVAHYRRAAMVIRRFHHSLAEMIEAGTDLASLPGLGKGLAGYLSELVHGGGSPRLEEYRGRIPPGLREVMRLDGVGATRARTLGDAGIDSVEELEAALARREVTRLNGFGPAVVGRLQRGLAARAELVGKSLLSEADRVAERVRASLARAGIEGVVAGEVRRRLEIVAAIDIVCAAEGDTVREEARRFPEFRVSCGRGDNPAEGTLEGVRVRLWAVPERVVGAAVHHLTGPPSYLEVLAERARDRGLELTPAGIRDGAGSEASSETEIYAALGLPWIPPEVRRNGDTVARAEAGTPRLVERGDITGDLHLHTTWSDGTASLERMVQAAAERGYRYVAITDHSPSVGVVSGLDAARLRAQATEISRVQQEYPDIAILRGCEVDILRDGTLDLDDEVMAELDVVLAAVHSAFDMTASDMTDRIIRAMENPLVHVLCHPTGRRLGRRGPCPLNLSEILNAARDLDVAVEVNGSPGRLDLDHRGLWLCRELGVRVVVSSDAHSATRLGSVDYGVDQARRGWLRRSRIVNTGTLAEVVAWLGRRRG